MQLLSELQCIDELYQALHHEFPRRPVTTDADDAALVETVLRNENLLSRVGLLNERVARAAGAWKDFRERADAPTRAQVESLIRAVRAHAEDLQRACAQYGRRLESRLDRLGRERRRLQTGLRYLDSVKPARTNYPKFVDSVG